MATLEERIKNAQASRVTSTPTSTNNNISERIKEAQASRVTSTPTSTNQTTKKTLFPTNEEVIAERAQRSRDTWVQEDLFGKARKERDEYTEAGRTLYERQQKQKRSTTNQYNGGSAQKILQDNQKREKYDALSNDERREYYYRLGKNGQEDADRYLLSNRKTYKRETKPVEELPEDYDTYTDYAESGLTLYERMQQKKKNQQEASGFSTEAGENQSVQEIRLGAMTNDERQMYYYQLAKGGQEAADNYLQNISPQLNARLAAQEAQEIRSMPSGIGKALRYGAQSVMAGVDQASKGIAQALTGNVYDNSQTAITSGMIGSELSGLKRSAYNAGVSIGNMLPAVTVSLLTHGAGAPALLANAASGLTTALGSGGNAYGEAIKEGYDETAARTYGTLIGASEAAIGEVIGGVSALAGQGISLTEKLVSKVSGIENGLARWALSQGIRIGAEVNEEEVQNFLEPLFRTVIFGEDYDAPTIQELVDTAITTAISTGIMNFGQSTPYNPTYDAEATATDRAMMDTLAGRETAENPNVTQETDLDRVMQQTFAETKYKDVESVAARYGLSESTAKNVLEIVNGWDITGKNKDVLQNLAKSDAAKAAIRELSGVEVEGNLASSRKAIKDIWAAKRPKTEVSTEVEEAETSAPEERTEAEEPPVSTPPVEVRAYFNNVNGKNGYYLIQDGRLVTRGFFDTERQAQNVADAINTRNATLAERQRVQAEATQAEPERVDTKNESQPPISRADAAIEAVGGKQQETVAAQRKPTAESSVGAAEAGSGETGDMGAKTSAFKHEVKQSQTQSNTLDRVEEKLGVPKEERKALTYDTISEEESLNNARLRLETDYAGEIRELQSTPTWTGEQVDMGMLELGIRRRQAEQTGDWTAYREWRKIQQEHGTTSAQALQALAKWSRRNTGDWILSEAESKLDNARKGTDVDSVLSRVSDFSTAYDQAVANQSVGELKQIIKDTSHERRTGSFRKNELSKQMNWALDRIAKYAETEVSGGKIDGENYQFLQDLASAGIVSIATDYNKVSFGKGVMTIRRNSMLSKVATILRNLTGNNVFDPIDSVSMNMAVPIDILISKITGTRSTAVDLSWASAAKRKGSFDALAKSMLEVGLDINAEGAKSKYETSKRTFKMNSGVVSRLLSRWEKYMGYGLNVTDEFQKGGIRAETERGINDLYRRGLVKDDTLLDEGNKQALYRTYQHDSKLSKTVGGVRTALNNVEIMPDMQLGDLAIPFAQVPSNLPSIAIDYSPIGLARGAWKLAQTLIDAHNGTLTAAQQADAVKTLGRGLNGTSLIGISAALAVKGIIHVAGVGDDDENKDKVAADKTRGWYDTQFNVSALLRWIAGESTEPQHDDFQISIGFLDPINAQFTTGALIAEDIKNGEANLLSVVEDSITGTLQAVLDLPIMDVFKDVYQAYEYSDGANEGEKLVDAAKEFAASQVSSLVPNVIRGIAQGLDPYIRDEYGGETLGERTLDKIKGSIPGLRETLPIAVDSFGNEKKNDNRLLNFLNMNILPGSVTRYKGDNELLTEMDRLNEETGSASMYPSRKAPNKLMVAGNEVSLNREQKLAYQTVSNRTYTRLGETLMHSANYAGVNADVQTKALNFAETYAKAQAASSLGIGYEPDEQWMRDLEGKSDEEIANALLKKAALSVGGIAKYSETPHFNATEVAGMDAEVVDKVMAQANTYADWVALERMGYDVSDAPEWVREVTIAKNEQEELLADGKELEEGTVTWKDMLVQIAVESAAKANGKNKYDGLSNMLDSGDITDATALLVVPSDAREKYEKTSAGHISVSQLVETVGLKNAAKDEHGNFSRDIFVQSLNDTGWTSEEKAYAWLTQYKEITDMPTEWYEGLPKDILTDYTRLDKKSMPITSEDAAARYKTSGATSYLDAAKFAEAANKSMEFKTEKDENGKDIDGSKAKQFANWLDTTGWSATEKATAYATIFKTNNMPEGYYSSIPNTMVKSLLSKDQAEKWDSEKASADKMKVGLKYYDTLTSDKDKNGNTITNSKMKKFRQKIAEQNWTQAEKRAVFCTFYSSKNSWW